MATINEVLGIDLAHIGDFIPDPTADFGKIFGIENVKVALYHRLVTEPGTLIHRPTYGVGIKQWLNAPSTLAQERVLAARIQEQFAQDARVDAVTAVRIERGDSQPDLTKILVRVKIVGYDEEVLEFIPFGEIVNG